ncbi:LysM peptidoglycan-binding domain-containing protein [Bifidobacterium psychraerophilum]|jgi:Tfp pilus assembly protein FimV
MLSSSDIGSNGGMRDREREVKKAVLEMSVAISGAAVRSQSHPARTSQHMRLTLRGKVTATLLAVGIAFGVFAMVTPENADSATGAVSVTSYTVRPGDTLWAYASSITPAGHDVSETVNELMDLNNLDSAALTAGQRLVVPVEAS